MRIKDNKKKQIIYDATLSLVQKEGISWLKIVTIAKQAKIATGTVYIYFKNKDILLNSLYHDLKQETLELIDYATLQWSNEEKLSTLRKTITYFRIHNYEKSIFLRLFNRSQYITPKNKNISEPFKTYVYALLDTLKSSWVIKQYDTALLINTLDSLMESTAKYSRDNNSKDTDIWLEIMRNAIKQ
jgi:AcrR family transcriptional regulator